jgi:predicted transposase YdaD
MPHPPHTPHDGIFKATFSQVEHAAGELRAVLPPALAARLDFTTLTLCPGSFVDEAFSWRHTDLLFSATFADRPALVYLLFEHQSTVDSRMPFRLLRYMIRIWEAHLAKYPEAEKLPVILPVVLHHGEGGWRAAVAFEDLLDVEPDLLAELGAYVPRFRFVLDDLDATTDDAIRARSMSALGRFVLWCLKHARRQGFFKHELGSWGSIIRDAWNAPDGGAAIRRIFRYIFEVDDQLTVDELKQLATTTIGEDVEEEIVTLADRLREEGRQKGERIGERTGERKLLLKQLTLRFGQLPEAALARVTAAGVEQLETWAERVLTAPTLAEVIDAS